MSESIRDKSISGFIWLFIDKAGASVINLVVTVLLARLLTPEDFGLVAMVMVFFEISSAFINSGFSFALIRQKSISDEDKSTTFIFNLVVACILYAILFLSAPAIANFFGEVILIWIVRIMGLNLIINSLGIIQQAVLTHKIDFKTQTRIRIVAVSISSAIAIGMAFSGFGVWSLVAKLMLMEGLTSLLLWIYHPWKILLKFSRQSFKRLFGFGSNLLAEAIIHKVFQNILQVIIGRFFTASTLGYYSQANYLTNVPANNFQQIIQKVTYPVLSKLQDDKMKLKRGYREIMLLSSFIIIPIMVIIGVMANPIIVSFLGEKWEPSTPFLQLLCLGGITYHFNSINLDLLLVLGRADLCLRVEIVKKVITAIAIIIGIQFGIYGLVLGYVVSHYLALIINTYYSDKFLSYGLTEQLSDIGKTILISAIMGILVYVFSAYGPVLPNIWKVIIAVILAISIYLGCHFLLKSEEIKLIHKMVIPRTYKFFVRG